MVLLMTWCMTETVFSQAVCEIQKEDKVTSTLGFIEAVQVQQNQISSRCATDLQVLRMMVSPG